MDNITLLVSALISDRSGRVLLTGHAPTWKLHLPDGDVRFGETLRAALIRSVREDLAVDIVPEARPFHISETFGKDGTKHFLTFHFRASLDEAAVPKARPGCYAGFFLKEDIGMLHVIRSTFEAVARSF